MHIEKKTRHNKYLIYFLAIMAGIVAACLLFYSIEGSGAFSNILYSMTMTLNDKIYQSPKALDGKIKIIGIEERSLEEIGPFNQWTRADMAQVIEILNADPKCRPAVVGVDIMYFGNTEEEEDNYFAEVCQESGNVVTASLVNFASKLVVNEDGTHYMDDYGIDSFEEPYESLKKSSYQGYCNTMTDKDGVIRTSIHQVQLDDGSMINSFAYEIYRLYRKVQGLPQDVNPPMNSRYQWYIPYSAKQGGYYDNISVADILNGEISPEELKDAIVLIGPYAPGLMDNWRTAIDHVGQMYGVEIHANIIDALLHTDFKAYIPITWQCVILFFVTAICIVLCSKWKVLTSAMFCTGMIVCYIIIAKISYEKGYILHLLWIPLVITVIFVASVVFHYIRTSLEKRKVVDTFKRYVAPQVVDQIFKEGVDNLELGGKMTDIACLFVDIRGFTTMSENLDPPQVVEILNTYLNLTSSCILKYNGTLDKFVGDATMALFNAPLPQEDYVYKAVRAAWDMVQGSESVSKELMERFGRSVSFGIGVHCGKAVVGNIGAKIRMDYTAIGDTVNTASRLESNAKGGQILISRAVYDQLEGRIKATSLGDTIKLKGKSQEFEILSVDEVM